MARRFIYYDTETTGVKASQDRIIEIAAFDPEHDKTFERMINPGVPIPKEASAIHNITDDMVANAPSFQAVGEEFLEFCQGEVILVAHNGDNFDIPFVKEEFKRCGKEFPSIETLDTLKWARRYRPDLPRHTLQFLREIYGIPANNAHRALDDVLVLHRIFSLMIGDLDADCVMELLGGNRETKPITHMPFGKHRGLPLSEVPKAYIRWLAGSGALDKTENEELKRCFDKLGMIEEPVEAQ